MPGRWGASWLVEVLACPLPPSGLVGSRGVGAGPDEASGPERTFDPGRSCTDPMFLDDGLMYLLLRPGQMLLSSGASEDDVDEALRANPDRGFDLGRLEWQPFDDWPLDEDTIRVAIRHGTATREGIAVGAQSIVPLWNWRVQRSFLPAGSTSLPGAEVMDQFYVDDWRELARARDSRIDAGRQRGVEQARGELDAALAAAVPEATLVEHWRNLGGVLPTPL